MKKTYEAPVVEKIEFDYAETVTACTSFGGGGAAYDDEKQPLPGQEVYRDSNNWYRCGSSLKPDSGCGYNGVHTSNVGYICGM